MARLQKHFAYTYKEKKHFKHVLLIPPKTVKILCWKPGQELELKQEVARQTLIVSPKKKIQQAKVRSRRISKR